MPEKSYVIMNTGYRPGDLGVVHPALENHKDIKNRNLNIQGQTLVLLYQEFDNYEKLGYFVLPAEGHEFEKMGETGLVAVVNKISEFYQRRPGLEFSETVEKTIESKWKRFEAVNLDYYDVNEFSFLSVDPIDTAKGREEFRKILARLNKSKPNMGGFIPSDYDEESIGAHI